MDGPSAGHSRGHRLGLVRLTVRVRMRVGARMRMRVWMWVGMRVWVWVRAEG